MSAAAEPVARAAAKASLRARLQVLGMLPVLLLLCVGFELMSNRFLSLGNVSIVAQQASINTVLAAGMTFVLLTGGIDLSVGSVLAASAMVTMLVSTAPAFGLLAIPAGLLAGVAFGAANGALIAGLGLPPFIVTLGSLTAVRGIARLIGSDGTVFNPDLGFAFLGNETVLGVPWLVVIAGLVIVASWFVLRRTVFGLRVYAVGGNVHAAHLSGIRVGRILMAVYMISGLLAGLGGIMSAARLYAANGLQLGQSYELDAIAAAILGGISFTGGIGSIWGTLIGALIIAILTNGLILVGVSDIWQFIVKGLVIVVAVTLDRLRLQGGART